MSTLRQSYLSAPEIADIDDEILVLVFAFVRDAQKVLDRVIPSDIFNLCARFYNVYADSGEFTWDVDKQTLERMKKSDNKANFPSPTFNIAGLSWRIECYPNGNTKPKIGSFIVFVKCVSMPDDWKHIECCPQIRCNETMTGDLLYFQFHKGRSVGWPDRAMLLSEIQSLRRLSFTVKIHIHRIVLKKEDEVFYERAITAENIGFRWEVDRKIIELLKSAHEGKWHISELYGGMYCVLLVRKSSHLAAYLCLGALPKGERKVDLSWTIEVIATGQDDFETTKTWSLDQDLTINDLGVSYRGNTELLPLDDLRRSNTLVFNVNITVNDNQQALEHWNRVIERPAELRKQIKDLEVCYVCSLPRCCSEICCV